MNFIPSEIGSFDDQIQRLQARRDGAQPALQRALESGNLDVVTMLASLHATPGLHRELGGLVEPSLNWFMKCPRGVGAFSLSLTRFLDPRGKRLSTPATIAH